MNVNKKIISLGFKKVYPMRVEYSYYISEYILTKDIEETKIYNGQKIKTIKEHSKKVTFFYKEISYSGVYIKKICDTIEIIWIVDIKNNKIKSEIYPTNIASLTDIITNLPKNISRDLLITELLK